MDEHVENPVGVPGHEVGGGRDEGHEAPVGADGDDAAPAVPLGSGVVHARARESKATKRPLALIDGGGVGPSGGGPICSFPALLTLTRSVVWADTTAGVARRARTPTRRPTTAILREDSSAGAVHICSVVMVP